MLFDAYTNADGDADRFGAALSFGARGLNPGQQPERFQDKDQVNQVGSLKTGHLAYSMRPVRSFQAGINEYISNLT